VTSDQESSARAKLWADAYQKWYDAYFNENAANALVSRWQAFNDPAKVIVAITASGSVIAGWTLWSQPGFKTFWIILAGTGALLSVISSSLTIPERIKDWTNTRADFSGVRVQAELLMTHMKFKPEFDIDAAHKALENIIVRYNDAVNRIRNDFLHTKSLDANCKQELDRVILQRKLWS
jgi:hypothetical protein